MADPIVPSTGQSYLNELFRSPFGDPAPVFPAAGVPRVSQPAPAPVALDYGAPRNPSASFILSQTPAGIAASRESGRSSAVARVTDLLMSHRAFGELSGVQREALPAADYRQGLFEKRNDLAEWIVGRGISLPSGGLDLSAALMTQAEPLPPTVVERYTTHADRYNDSLTRFSKNAADNPDKSQADLFLNLAKAERDAVMSDVATEILEDHNLGRLDQDPEGAWEQLRELEVLGDPAIRTQERRLGRAINDKRRDDQAFAEENAKVTGLRQYADEQLSTLQTPEAARAAENAILEAETNFRLDIANASRLPQDRREQALIQAEQDYRRRVQRGVALAGKERYSSGNFSYDYDGFGNKLWNWENILMSGTLGMMLYEGTIGEERKRKQARGDYLWRSQIELDSQMQMLNARAGHDMALLQERASISPAQPQRGTPSGSVVSTPGFFR